MRPIYKLSEKTDGNKGAFFPMRGCIFKSPCKILFSKEMAFFGTLFLKLERKGNPNDR